MIVLEFLGGGRRRRTAAHGSLCAFLLRRNATDVRVVTAAEAPADSGVDAAVARAGDA